MTRFGAIALLLSLMAGCGGAEEAVEESSAPAAAQPPAAEQDAGLLRYGTEAARELGFVAQQTGDLDAMTERRIIRVLVAYSNTFYFLDGPRQRGLTYDAFEMFEDWLNAELGSGHLKVYVMLIPTARDQLLRGIQEGYGDIAAAGLTITPERQALVDFSDPFMRGVNEIVVTGPGAPTLESIDDLSGQKVYVRTASSYYASLRALNARLEAAARAPAVLNPAEPFLEDEDLLEMVDSGILPIVVVDQHKAEFWSQIYENITPRPDLALREGGTIAWAFRKHSPKLAAVLNRFVAGHRQGTLMGNILLNRYLKDTRRVRNALAARERERFRDTIALFRRHAPEYGFDYLLIAAQGYQESRLDQSVVSRAGAIGIMQVLPSTAAEPSVGVSNLGDPEQNVLAGIRYLAWIRDTYFNEPGMDDFNEALFCFAAYNAGPSRVARLRRKAVERELDPDVWFRNVEIIAAEEIGRETVQYVRNIYKYYAAYRLLGERAARKGKTAF